MIGSRGYNAYNEKRTGLYLLNNLLGGPGMNSRLNVSLRERRGLVYNVEANLTSYTDTGVFCIYFGTDPEDADRCIGLVHKELKKLRDSKLSSSQLSASKKTDHRTNRSCRRTILRTMHWIWEKRSCTMVNLKVRKKYSNG